MLPYFWLKRLFERYNKTRSHIIHLNPPPINGRRVSVVILLALLTAPAWMPPAFAGADKPAANPPLAICRALGPQWSPLGKSDFCTKKSGIQFYYLNHDFAKSDIVLHGSRTSTNVPLIFYESRDVSKQTKYPRPGAILSYNWEVIGNTSAGPILLHFGLTASVERGADRTGAGKINTNFWNANSNRLTLYGGLINQAWLRFGKFQVGIQPSKFDFLQGGYSLGQKYTPQQTTASIVFNYRRSNSFSFSLALEDPNRRILQDGILNRYAYLRKPDVVAQLRFSKNNTIYQVGVAAHKIEDQFANQSTYGYAGILALEHKFLWADVAGKNHAPILGVAGRVYASVAVARGALGYLGAPYFATDYTVNNTGDIQLSNGISAILSYENVWSQTLKGNITLSYFRSKFGAVSTIPLGSTTSTLTVLGQTVKSEGYRLSIGYQKILSAKTRYGVELAQNLTTSIGTVGTSTLVPIKSSYPELLIYFAMTF